MKAIGKFIIEALSVALVAGAVVCLCDARRVFAADDSNDHTGKRWLYLYHYAKQNIPVDILVLGNSHAYTGLIPERIQEITGRRCFLLAAPTVTIDDCSYMLEEALSILKPRLVVIETYPISSYVQKNLAGQDLSGQFASFGSRRNVMLKLKSTFKLFKLSTAPYAWSPTLRNHDMLFDDTEQLEKNLKNPSPRKVNPGEEYLGRYVRFTSGLTAATLKKYASDGPPVDGSAIKPGPDAKKAVARMKRMCRERNIQVIFLTIPMYKDHVKDAVAWHNNLKPVIGEYPWLDLQLPEYGALFGPNCFEDTYNVNQHLTGDGALLASRCLTQYIDWLNSKNKKR